MLGPLLGAALDNALRSGDQALTGPVARGDAGTVAAHLRELRKVSPEGLAAYVAMARLTADRALAAGLLKPEAAEALLEVLAGRITAVTQLVHTRADLRAAVGDRAAGELGVVMSLGALHDGHRALIQAARTRCDTVVVTVFLNPLQFAPTEDLSRYPQTLDSDLALCREEGVDAVFAPDVDEVYPAGRRWCACLPDRSAMYSRARRARVTSTVCSRSSESCCTSPRRT